MRNVSQSLYDRQYYIENCNGYTQDGGLCRRLKSLMSFFPKGEGLSVVDVGCGRGEVSKFLTEKGHSVFSIDYSYAACQIFGENCGDNVPFLRHDISTGLPWIKDGYFDVAVMADIIEHLYSEQLEALSVELNRILKSGAIALADTPIMAGGESVMHVDIKDSAAEVMRYFPWARLIGTHWHMKPEHCHFIMEKI